MTFTKASELKSHIGQKVQWVRACDPVRGVEFLSVGTLERIEGKNLVIDGDWVWFPKIKDSLTLYQPTS